MPHRPKTLACMSAPKASAPDPSKLALQERDIAKLKLAIEKIPAHYGFYHDLARYMKNGKSAQVPAHERHAEALETQLSKMSSMCHEFLQKLEAESKAYDAILAEATSATARQDRWWIPYLEDRKLFSAEYEEDDTAWDQLCAINPPSGIEYTQHVLQKAQIINAKRSPPNPDPFTRSCICCLGLSHATENPADTCFFPKLTKEADLIALSSSQHYTLTFDFYMTIKLTILQSPTLSRFQKSDKIRLDQHAQFDARIASLLDYDYPTSDFDGFQRYVNASQRCNDVRERMQRVDCGDTVCLGECTFNIFIPLLDVLQRRAYEELRFKASLATRSRLPPEMQFLVFQHLMDLEEVPRDPRVLVDAEWKVDDGESKARKARLACQRILEHDRDEMWVRIGDTSWTLVCGDEWVETEGRFRHFDEGGRRREWEEMCITKGGLLWPDERSGEYLDGWGFDDSCSEDEDEADGSGDYEESGDGSSKDGDEDAAGGGSEDEELDDAGSEDEGSDDWSSEVEKPSRRPRRPFMDYEKRLLEPL